MTAMILYRPDSDEEVLETEILHTRQGLVSALLGKGISLRKSQFYVWLKHCEVTPSRANQYSQDDFDRLLHFAQLMKRYGEIKAAKTKFHQRYPVREVHETQSHQKEKTTQENETYGREQQTGTGDESRSGSWRRPGQGSGTTVDLQGVTTKLQGRLNQGNGVETSLEKVAFLGLECHEVVRQGGP